MKQTLFVYAFLFVINTANAQHPLVHRAKAGEKVPDLMLQNCLDRKYDNTRIFALGAKLYILDFWNVHCTSCIHSMPEMQLLQKEFSGRLRIILITKDSPAEVNRLLTRLHINIPDLVVITGDSKWNALFPHIGEPHHVWIGADKKILYATQGYNATRENVTAVLKGKKLNVSLKSEMEGLSEAKTFLDKAQDLKGRLSAYSLFLKGLHELTGSYSVQMAKDSASHQLNYLHVINAPVITLYGLAYNQDLFGIELNAFNIYHNNRIIGDPAIVAAFQQPTDGKNMDAWRNDNLCSYELKLAPGHEDEFYSAMQEDLERYLDFSCLMTDTIRDCLVLVRTSGVDKLRTRDSSVPSHNSLSNGLHIQNDLLSRSLIKELVYTYQDLLTPIVNGTGYDGPIDMEITGDFGNLDNVKKELRRYDLDLVYQKQKIKSLVIEHKTTGFGQTKTCSK